MLGSIIIMGPQRMNGKNVYIPIISQIRVKTRFTYTFLKFTCSTRIVFEYKMENVVPLNIIVMMGRTYIEVGWCVFLSERGK